MAGLSADWRSFVRYVCDNALYVEPPESAGARALESSRHPPGEVDFGIAEMAGQTVT